MSPRRPDDPARAPRVFLDERLWRAVDVYRGLTLCYAVALFVPIREQYRRPWGAAAVLALMAIWTVYLHARRALLHRPIDRRVLVADLGVGAGCVLATLLVDDPVRIASEQATLPSIWAASPVVGLAVGMGWRCGLGAALVIIAADVVEIFPKVNSGTVDSAVQLMLVGTVVGYTVELYTAGRRDLARAVAVEASARERSRLAADIHDSVLQVLAYVRRRGAEIGGEAAEIGRLAGEQELRLRAVIAAVGSSEPVPVGDIDVKAALAALGRDGVTITGPAGPVLLAAERAGAVVAAVAAALDNVVRHAGTAAKAWVLVEDEPGVVTVTVRDDGIGLEPGRLEEAARDGRLGFAVSVRRRIEDVGGTVSVLSRPGEGAEIELSIPKEVARA